MLDIYESTIIKVSTNRIKNLESKITNFQEENKQFKCNVKALRESIKSQNKTYEKTKKDMMENKQKLETDYRNNEEVQNLIHQNTIMKEQIAKLEDMDRRNNTRREIWEKSRRNLEQKVKHVKMKGKVKAMQK